jgi:antitoxin Phd
MSGAAKRSRDDTVSSTEAQNNFGDVLARVSREGRVFITRYHRREAVVLSMDAYADLVAEEAVDLDALEQDFEDMVERMQSPEHSAAVDRLFALTPEQLGEAAGADAATDETDRE